MIESFQRDSLIFFIIFLSLWPFYLMKMLRQLNFESSKITLTKIKNRIFLLISRQTNIVNFPVVVSIDMIIKNIWKIIKINLSVEFFLIGLLKPAFSII